MAQLQATAADFGFASATTTQLTYGSTLTPGSKLIAWGNISGDKSAAFTLGASTGFADTAGNIWRVRGIHYYAAPNYTLVWAECDNSSAQASNQVTISWGSSGLFRGIGVGEWSALATGAPEAVTAGNDNTSTTTTPTDTSITTLSANALVIAWLASDGPSSVSAGSGYALVTSPFNASGTAWESKIQAVAGATTPTFTQSPALRCFVMSASFAAAGGAAKSRPILRRPLNGLIAR